MRCTCVFGATVLEWVQAAGTLGAVAAAVGIAYWGARRETRRQPALSLAFDPELRSPDFMAGMLSGDGTLESHWVRLRVENDPGRRSADDVEVLFISLEAAGEHHPVRTLDVVPLRWSSTQGDSGGALTRITIPPGLSRHVDLLAIGGRQEGSPSNADKPIVAIQVWPPPTDDRHLLPGGSYVFHLAVTARDTDTAYFSLEAKVPGERFSAAQIRQHLTVSTPAKERPEYLGGGWRHQGGGSESPAAFLG